MICFFVGFRRFLTRLPEVFPRSLGFGFVLLCTQLTSLARILPEPGAQLYQKQLMLTWDEIAGADRYHVELVGMETDAPKRKQAQRMSWSTTGICHWITEGLAFGHTYRWQYRAYRRNKLLYTSPKYTFSIQAAPQVLPTRFRVDVLEGKTPSTDLFFLDRLGIAINRNGEPIWFTPGAVDSLLALNLRDVELTPWGSITYLHAQGAYEINLQHQVQWQGPNSGEVSGSKSENYHHELMALPDGGFMVAGLSATNDPGEVGIKQSTPQAYRQNTIIRYNRAGQATWVWNEAKKGSRDSLLAFYRKAGLGSHLNGFCFTPDGTKLVVSFKNYSDIAWMDLTSGRFIGSLKRTASNPSADFQQQHGPRFTRDGRYLLLYNNNLPNENAAGASPKIIHPSVMWYRWQDVPPRVEFADAYELVSARHPEGIEGKEGYVSESRPGHLLICTGGANYLTEITLAKRKTWEAYLYFQRETDSTWQPLSNYRCQAASSLYPWFATAQVANSSSNPSVLITNAGTEPHALRVTFSKPGKPNSETRTTALLAPQASAEVQVPPDFRGAGEFQVEIRSTQFQEQPQTYRFRSQRGELQPVVMR